MKKTKKIRVQWNLIDIYECIKLVFMAILNIIAIYWATLIIIGYCVYFETLVCSISSIISFELRWSQLSSIIVFVLWKVWRWYCFLCCKNCATVSFVPFLCFLSFDCMLNDFHVAFAIVQCFLIVSALFDVYL